MLQTCIKSEIRCRYEFKSSYITAFLENTNNFCQNKTHTLYPGCKAFVYIADQKQPNTSHARLDCGKLALFLLLQTLKRGNASQDFAEKHSVPTFMFRNKWYLKKDPSASEIICFFMRIFHQRHENWLHLLIAPVLFVRMPWSKVQDIPETFFVTYHQETIVKSSQLLQNMVLNTHRVVRLGYYHHRWVNYLDTSNIGEFFLKNDTTSSKEYGQKWHRRLLHIEKRKFHGRQKFPDVVRMISI